MNRVFTVFLFFRLKIISIKIASFNANGLGDHVKAVCLLRGLLSFGVGITAIQETYFVCNVDTCVLSNDFSVYSAYGRRLAEASPCW